MRSCGPRTPDSATLTMWSGISGATRSKVDRSTLRVLEVARVDADDLRPGVHGALRLLLVVGLDERGQADRLGALDQRDEGLLVEGGDDQQGEVGAVGPGLPQLVRGDDEVLAQDRDVDLGADGLQVGERTAEAALLGEDRDDGRAAGLVVRGERGRVGDGGKGALGGAGALDLADDGHALAAQGGDSVLGLGSARGAFLELVEADTRLPLREVGADAVDDLVEHTHASGPLPEAVIGTGSAISMVSAGRLRARIRRPDVPLPGHSGRQRRAEGQVPDHGEDQQHRPDAPPVAGREADPQQACPGSRGPPRAARPRRIRRSRRRPGRWSRGRRPGRRGRTAWALRSPPQPGQNRPVKRSMRADRVVAGLVGVDRGDVAEGPDDGGHDAEGRGEPAEPGDRGGSAADAGPGTGGLVRGGGCGRG